MQNLEEIICPICKSGELQPEVRGDTEIWICPECPVVLFTYYSEVDLYNLRKILRKILVDVPK